MMSLERFAERCGGLIKQQVPFIAYRHDRGCGVLLLDGGLRTEYTVEYKYRAGGTEHTAREATTDPQRLQQLLRQDGRVIKERDVHKLPQTGTVKGFRRAIAKMKKDRRTQGSLYTVEYDGSSYCIEGDSLLAMIGEMGL